MKRLFRHIVALALCLCIALLPLAARTDFGDFSGDSDYGGSSSWDSGSSSSWDDDDDYYYAGSSGGGSDGDFPGGLWVAVVIIIVLFAFRKKKPQASGSAPAGAQQRSAASLTPIERYTELDPGFDAAAMQERIANLYVQMQHCWQDKDISSLRPYFTDALFTQMDRQLDGLKQRGLTNRVERIAVLGVTLRGFYRQAEEDHIVAEVRTRIVDYTVNDETQALISGDRTKEKFMTYEWDLSRQSGRTTEEKAEMEDIHCPNCGAPVAINTTAKCPYCDSVITLSAHDWALCSIKGVAQQTR